MSVLMGLIALSSSQELAAQTKDCFSLAVGGSVERHWTARGNDDMLNIEFLAGTQAKAREYKNSQ